MMRRRSPILTFVVVALFLFASLSLAADFEYMGSRKSDQDHYSTCRAAKMIYPENLKTFNSAKEAQDAGYVPCKISNLPVKD
jgi:hypothetical protein